MKIRKKQLLYLASLYATGAKSELTLKKRYDRVLWATSFLLSEGYFVFSPIVHNHPVNLLLKENPGWSFWGPYDKNILKRCDAMVILADDGWEDSNGINAEIKFAKLKNIPIYILYLDDGSIDFEKYE